jgi:hypothetical protein
MNTLCRSTHERRPLLFDLVPMTAKSQNPYPYVNPEGDTLFSEITSPPPEHGLGAALWFIASPLYNNQDHCRRIESIRDVSEWKQARRALNEASALPQALGLPCPAHCSPIVFPQVVL